MPTVSVNKSWLDSQLGKNYTENEFDELCFDFGLELDEITTEKLQVEKERGTQQDDKQLANLGDALLYKIEIPANRYDLLCRESIAQALRVYMKKQKMPVYKKIPPKNNKFVRITVNKEVANVRPFIIGAVLRNVTLDADSYASLIDLQDKLHQNLCRKRVLVAMGTYDLDKLEGPFTYTAIEPSKLKFKPLNQTTEYTAQDLMKLYSTDSHLRHYLHIIENEPLYPVILDKNQTVLSMPPIINSDQSKITLDTKNIFIDVTAVDLTRAKIVLDTLVTSFSVYCKEKFTVEPVEVQQIDGTVAHYPELKYWTLDLCSSDVCTKVGVKLTPDEIIKLLEIMSFRVEKITPTAATTGCDLRVTVPPTRHDILHACDVVEDVAIAYGYNNIEKIVPQTSTIASQSPVNKLTDLLRNEIAQAGFTEALTFSLCSMDDIWSKLRQPRDDVAVHIANPKTLEFQVARTTLLPGMLKTIGFNKDMPLPLKLFEMSDVVLKDSKNANGARNERRFCAVYYSKTSGFEIIHGLLDRLMEVLGVPFGHDDENYYIKETDDPTFFPGRGALVYGPGHKLLGKLGVLHPEVLTAFELNMPCSMLEINIQPFV